MKSTSLNFTFNATEFDPTQGEGQLPLGKYKVQIVKGGPKAKNNGDGGYLELVYQKLEGEDSGVTGSDLFNVYEPDPEKRDWALKKLSRVAHCIGVYSINDVSQMCGIPFMIEVIQDKNDDRYTRVSKYFDVNGNPPRKGQPPTPQQPQQPQHQTQQFAPQQPSVPFGGQVVSHQPQQPQMQTQTQWEQPQPQQSFQPHQGFQPQQAPFPPAQQPAPSQWDNPQPTGMPNPFGPR